MVESLKASQRVGCASHAFYISWVHSNQKLLALWLSESLKWTTNLPEVLITRNLINWSTSMELPQECVIQRYFIFMQLAVMEINKDFIVLCFLRDSYSKNISPACTRLISFASHPWTKEIGDVCSQATIIFSYMFVHSNKSRTELTIWGLKIDQVSLSLACSVPVILQCRC